MIVVYFAPYINTTTGHSNIKRILMGELHSLPGVVPMPVFSPTALTSWLDSTAEPPSALITDFPDTGYRRYVRKILKHPKMENCRLVHVSMFAPKIDPDPEPALNYDAVIGLEHDFSTDRRWPYTPDLTVGPLLRREYSTFDTMVQRSTESALKRIDSLPPAFALSLQTGLATERGEFDRRVLATEARIGDGLPLIPSRSLANAPLPIACQRATRVYSAGGYSGVWELACYTQLSKVTWIMYSRPAEDCDWRVYSAFALQGANHTPLLEQDPLLVQNNLDRLRYALHLAIGD